MTSPVDVEAVMRGLKDFQRDTAEYAFSRLFGDNPTTRFLVADEVGLGKTLVARGVIAMAIDHLKKLGDPRTDIVYVCSNAAIAQQNINKLNVLDTDTASIAERITMLAVGDHAESALANDINFLAITPNTSLKLGNSPGTFKERALLFAILDRMTGDGRLHNAGGKRTFYLGINEDDPAAARDRLDYWTWKYGERLDANPRFLRDFGNALRDHNREVAERGEGWKWQVELRAICKGLSHKRGDYSDIRGRRNRFIGRMRELLALVLTFKLADPDALTPDDPERTARAA